MAAGFFADSIASPQLCPSGISTEITRFYRALLGRSKIRSEADEVSQKVDDGVESGERRRKSTAVASFSHSLNNCNGNVRPGLFGCRAAHRVLLLLSFGVRFLSSSSSLLLRDWTRTWYRYWLFWEFLFYFMLRFSFLLCIHFYEWAVFVCAFFSLQLQSSLSAVVVCSMLLVQIYSKALKRPVICARYHDALPMMVSWWDVKSLRRACYFFSIGAQSIISAGRSSYLLLLCCLRV